MKGNIWEIISSFKVNYSNLAVSLDEMSMSKRRNMILISRYVQGVPKKFLTELPVKCTRIAQSLNRSTCFPPSVKRQVFSEGIVGNRVLVINLIRNFFGDTLYFLGS